MTTLANLAHDDLGLYTVAICFVAFAAGMCFLAICLAWDKQQRHPQPTSTPASSNRKSGRVGGGRS